MWSKEARNINNQPHSKDFHGTKKTDNNTKMIMMRDLSSQCQRGVITIQMINSLVNKQMKA